MIEKSPQEFVATHGEHAISAEILPTPDHGPQLEIKIGNVVISAVPHGFLLREQGPTRLLLHLVAEPEEIVSAEGDAPTHAEAKGWGMGGLSARGRLLGHSGRLSVLDVGFPLLVSVLQRPPYRRNGGLLSCNSGEMLEIEARGPLFAYKLPEL